MEFTSVGICLKPRRDDAEELIGGLRDWLQERGKTVFLDEAAGAALGGTGLPRNELADQVDLIVALGGDGTMLSVARAVADRKVPIFGVNLGRLGFLAAITRDELYPSLEKVFGGEVVIETRIRLEAHVEREGKEVGSFLALNDSILSCVGTARLIDLEAWIDGRRVSA